MFANETSKSSQMEAAVDVDDVAGGEWEATFEDGGAGAADVFWVAPAHLGYESIGDEGVVFFFDAGRHVGGHDAGAHFGDLDAFGGEACGVKLAGHGDASLGDAVFAAVWRGGVGRDR